VQGTGSGTRGAGHGCGSGGGGGGRRTAVAAPPRGGASRRAAPSFCVRPASCGGGGGMAVGDGRARRAARTLWSAGEYERDMSASPFRTPQPPSRGKSEFHSAAKPPRHPLSDAKDSARRSSARNLASADMSPGARPRPLVRMCPPRPAARV